MGLGSGNDGGGNTIYLNIAAGAIWQRDGKEVTTDHPNYREEEYEKVGAKEGDPKGIRKGLKFSNLSGHLDSVFFKENDWGEFMHMYVEDKEDGQLYDLKFKIDGAWTAYNISKRMMIALMMLDQSKPFTVNVSGKETDNGFLDVTLWVSQFGHNLVLNPNADPEKFDEKKQTAMPDEVKEMLATTRTKTKEENKEMSKKQKGRAREDEIDDVVGLIKEFFLDDINKNIEEKKAARKATPPKAKVTAPVEEAEPEQEEEQAEPEADQPAESTPSSEDRAERLKKLRERKKK